MIDYYHSFIGHRFEDPKGIYRSKIRGKFWPSFLRKDEPIFNFQDWKVDLQPHDVCIFFILISFIFHCIYFSEFEI